MSRHSPKVAVVVVVFSSLRRWGRPFGGGLAASATLLSLYFGLLTALAGWSYTAQQFARDWYFIVALALGFGIQVALFIYSRSLGKSPIATRVVATSGTTSTAAMISCCAHYLVYALPLLGVTGLVTLVSQYQRELFWVGIIANGLGIAYFVHHLMRRA